MPPFPNHYADSTALHRRMTVTRKLRTAYPDRVPVIMQSDPRSHLGLTQSKYLVPRNQTLGALLCEARKHTTYAHRPLPPQKALFLLVGDDQVLGSLGATMDKLHARYANEDGMLYVWMVGDNTFG